MRTESAFTMDASSIKYGPGATREVGHDVRKWGARRVMVVTDPNLAGTEPVAMVLDALRESGIDAVLFDQVEVEPTDTSFQAAITFAVEGRFDGYAAVGGGSSIDTGSVPATFGSVTTMTRRAPHFLTSCPISRVAPGPYLMLEVSIVNADSLRTGETSHE